MSTILRALRRLEEEKAIDDGVDLHESVVAPAQPAARPRRAWLVVFAAMLAAGVGAGVAWQLAPGGSERSIAELAPGGSGGSSEPLAGAPDVRAPEPLPPPRWEAPSPAPVAAAPPAFEVPPRRAAARVAAPPPVMVSEPVPAPARVAAVYVEEPREISPEVIVTERSPRPSLLAEEPLERVPPREVPAARVVRPRSVRPEPERVEPAPEPARVVRPPPVELSSASPAREPSPEPVALARVTAAPPERESAPRESMQRVGGGPARASDPVPVAVERVGRRPAALPEPEPKVLVRVAEPEPAPSRPSALPAPGVASSGLPEVSVTRTTWHPSPERRRALVVVNGGEEAIDLGEGENVGDLVITQIKPSGVVFEYQGVELKRRVGASN